MKKICMLFVLLSVVSTAAAENENDDLNRCPSIAEALATLKRGESPNDRLVVAAVGEIYRELRMSYPGKNAPLDLEAKKKIYREMYDESPEMLDLQIQEECCECSEELGFKDFNQNILLCQLHMEGSVAAVRAGGVEFDVIRVDQEYWQKSNWDQRRQLLAHEIFHILAHHFAHSLFANLANDFMEEVNWGSKIDFEQMRVEHEVFAEIAALDYLISRGLYSRLRLIGWAAIHCILTCSTPDLDDPHLMGVEKLLAFYQWKREKEALGLEDSASISILEYYDKNAPALKNFSKRWAENRKGSLKKYKIMDYSIRTLTGVIAGSYLARKI